MSVHSYNCRLQWIYGRDVSSGINEWFFAYCAYYIGIYTPLQKMHDDKVGKVYMWLVMEEMRVCQSLMAWGMVSDVLVPKFGASRGQVNLEVSLAGKIPDPVEAHVNRLQPFLLDCTVCKIHCCGVIYLHGSGGLGMSEFLEGRADFVRPIWNLEKWHRFRILPLRT